MLEICQKFGQEALQEKSPSQRKEIFLSSQTIVPQLPWSNFKGEPCEVIINLNTDTNEIELIAGEELDPEKRQEKFGFELRGSNSRKIYFTSNNAHYHLETIPDHIAYYEDNFEVNNSDYYKWLVNLRNQFYTQIENEEDNGDWYLDLRKLESRFSLENEIDFTKLSKTKELRSPFNELLSKKVLGSTRKNDVTNINIASLKINGEYVHKSKFKEDYIDVVYHNQFSRFYGSSQTMAYKNKTCSFCDLDKEVTGKIDITTKFYITDKHNFFENQIQKKAYKSFAICENCYQETLYGINQIKTNYEGRLFGAKYYLIPKNVTDIEKFENKGEYLIEEVFQRDMGNPHSEAQQHEDMLKEMIEENIRFDFLFFFQDQASFNIIEMIPDVHIKSVNSLISTMEKINKFSLYRGQNNLNISLNQLYWLLFPNKNSHSNPDSALYRKDLIGLFKALLKKTTVSYRTLLNRFRNIFSRIYYKKQSINSYINNPIKMNQLLEVFYRVTNLKGVKNMNKSVSTTKIPVKELAEFFQNHSSLYENNPHRQGLVMLGYLMNGIWYEQNSEGKSSTVFDKLNFEGMSPRRLDRFINEITEYLKLYDRWANWETGDMHAAMMDRLQDIKKSGLNKDEVLFYILTGFSIGRQIGLQKARRKEQKGESNE